MKYFAIAAAALCVAGCSSFTSVTPAGTDTYVVGSKKPIDKADWVDAKSTALTRAIDFCNKQKKNMEEIGVGAAGVPATTSPQRAEVTFKCVTRP
jgi:PBP1b-binding outer membrane lipoprotein LpoB